MHNTRILPKCCFFLVSLFSLFFIRQVCSRICYVCESSADEPCFNDVNQSDFLYDCAKTVTDYSNATEGSSLIHTLIKEYSIDYRPESNDDFDCVTIVGLVNVDEEKIIRGCISKLKNCSDLEAPLIFSQFLTDSCDRCDADLCNSHLKTKVPRLGIIKENTENYTKATTANAKSLVSLAKVMNFDYRVGFWCVVVLSAATFFRY